MKYFIEEYAGRKSSSLWACFFLRVENVPNSFRDIFPRILFATNYAILISSLRRLSFCAEISSSEREFEHDVITMRLDRGKFLFFAEGEK